MFKIRSLFRGRCPQDAGAFHDGRAFTAGQVVTTVGEDEFRVLVLRDFDAPPCADCGTPCLLLALGLKDGDRWDPIVLLHESKLAEMLTVLGEVDAFLRSPDRVARGKVGRGEE
jgi:hypothetical protein